MKFHNVKQKFIDLIPKDLNLCLLGLQGSRGHGLQERKDADYDYRGVYIAKNEDLLSLNKPKMTKEVNVGAGDDEAEFVFHEVEKFFALALKRNPSIIDLLFIPKWNVKTDMGDIIVKNRDIFLSDKAIRNAFGGYAMSQILYLKRQQKFPDGKKIGKHVKHCFRLFDQGQELLETGKITLPMKDPEKYFKISQERNIDTLFRKFNERDKEFRNCKSILPENPDEYMANQLLLRIRGFNH